MPVLYSRPDGDQRNVSVSLVDHEWGKRGTKPACLLRFQVDCQYGRDQRFQEAKIELSFTSTDSNHANPEIVDYGPVHIESRPTEEEHVNSTNGQVAVSLPMVDGVESSIGTERQSTWTQLHSGKMQGHKTLQKGSKQYDALAFQLEEDGRAKSGIFKISRIAVIVEASSEFVVKSGKPWTNPIGFSWTPHNKKLRIDNPVTIPFEEGDRDFSMITADDWNNMVLLGSGPQLLGNQSSPSLAAASSTSLPASTSPAPASAAAEPSEPGMPSFTWSEKHSRWYYQNGSNYIWVQGPWGQEKKASLQWQMHPDGQDRYYDGESWRGFGQ